MLYIVATPIGNMEDITLRALGTLKNVDIVACEDTRHTRLLLDRHGISLCHPEPASTELRTDKLHGAESKDPLKKSQGKGFLHSSPREVGRNDSRLVSFHQHSGEAKLDKMIEYLEEGKDVALVTDAGTPGISDPGSKLIKKAIEANIEITSVPGPTAFVTALSMSGFDMSEFAFIGFLPHKKGRQTKLKEIAEEKRTVVLYESVHRIKKLLKEFDEFIPEREICVARELTKKFEEIYRGKPAEIIDKVKEKGEFVVVIEGKK